MSTIHGTVWWSELMTRDVAASRAWYEQICGWRFEAMPMPEGEYHVAHAHGRPVAGVMEMTGMPGMDDLPPHWFTYLAVDDLDGALELAKAQGGTVIRPPFEVPQTGMIAIVTDAGGAALGLMQPEQTWEGSNGGESPVENVPV